MFGPETLPQATLPFWGRGAGAHKQRRCQGSGLLYVGCQFLVVGGVVAALAGEGLVALRQTLPGLPMMAKLVTGLNKCTELIKDSQLEDIHGVSWIFRRPG